MLTRAGQEVRNKEGEMGCLAASEGVANLRAKCGFRGCQCCEGGFATGSAAGDATGR